MLHKNVCTVDNLKNTKVQPISITPLGFELLRLDRIYSFRNVLIFYLENCFLKTNGKTRKQQSNLNTYYILSSCSFECI